MTTTILSRLRLGAYLLIATLGIFLELIAKRMATWLEAKITTDRRDSDPDDRTVSISLDETSGVIQIKAGLRILELETGVTSSDISA